MSPLKKIRLVILGGGGHARVLIDSLQTTDMAESAGVLDQDETLWGTELLGVPVLGGDDLLPTLVTRGATHFVVGVGAVGDNQPRRRLFELGLTHGLKPLTVCHPTAVCSPWAKIGPGSALCPMAVINPGAIVGTNVIVNTGAIVEHDCVIDDHAHLATGSRLSGTVHVGPAAHVGAGATVLQCLTIGEGAIVGAGAVVIKDVEPWTVVAGVPATLLEGRGQNVSNRRSKHERASP